MKEKLALLCALVHFSLAQDLTLPYFNIAEKKKVTVNATCGEDPTRKDVYCKLAGYDSFLPQTRSDILDGQVNWNCISKWIDFLNWIYFTGLWYLRGASRRQYHSHSRQSSSGLERCGRRHGHMVAITPHFQWSQIQQSHLGYWSPAGKTKRLKGILFFAPENRGFRPFFMLLCTSWLRLGKERESMFAVNYESPRLNYLILSRHSKWLT